MLYKYKFYKSLANYLYKEEGYYSYQPIIDWLGNVLVQVDDSDYQGDTRVLFKAHRYGILIFGWGSCSGCDALQACDSTEDIQELIDGLLSEIKWFDTLQEVKNYIISENRELEFSYHAEEWGDFRDKILAL